MSTPSEQHSGPGPVAQEPGDDREGQAVRAARSSVGVGRHYVQVFAFDTVSRGLLAVANVVLVGLLSQTELSTLTIAMTVVATLSQPLGWAVNRVYVITDEAAGDVEIGRRFLGAELLGTVAIAALAFPARRVLNGTYAAATLLAIAMTATEFGKTYYQRRLNFLAFSVAELARTIVVLAAISSMAALHRVTAEGMLLAQGVATAGVAVAMLARMRLRPASISASVRLLFDLARNDQRYLVGYFVLGAILPNVQPIILRMISSDLALATYGSAFRYYSVLLLAINATHVVLLPSLHAARSVTEMKRLLQTHTRVSVLFALGMATVAVASTWLIPIVDRGKYPESIGTFQVLCASSALSFALSPYVNVLLVRNDYRALLVVIGITLAVSFGLTGALVVSFGPIGAAVATLLSNALVNGWLALRARRILASRDGQ